ncbi:winged-helix DNA-binding transcription factor family protein [Actinidia rufa]|uniref:Winged-helix DNA-binding transcription factor family protein n=1 Tax=Actinidia rufa TaxID=165716 RepID=A0A7J0GWW3_9ERIC|nr:winged-helix DNA-binding transcription factor family protein [Actinidia rufa]
MAPPPGEQNGGESAAGQGPRSLPTPFLTKTFQLVDDPSIDDVISWNDDGSTRKTPPRRHTAKKSHHAGAAAVVSTLPAPQGTGSPSNSGEEQVISSNSSPRETSFGSTTTELVDENERLKKREHATQQGIESQMKNLCNNIYALMSNYSGNRPESGSQAVKPLDLMPPKRTDNKSRRKAGGRSQIIRHLDWCEAVEGR